MMRLAPGLLVYVVALGALTHAQDAALESRLTKERPGWRLATAADFANEVPAQQRQVVFNADFDRDGSLDWAAVLINERTRIHEWVFVLGRGRVHTLRSGATVRVAKPWFLKKAGEEGIGTLRYSDILPGYTDTVDAENAGRGEALKRARSFYASAAAVEICVSGYDLCGTQQAWYFGPGGLRSFTAGD